ncbi:MAG: ABC transporter substrate-binding protein [Deltaproteobacteria bacterium]|nr:ABC transporter substrate-binding protein [Deltaproteobacteria bacterium]
MVKVFKPIWVLLLLLLGVSEATAAPATRKVIIAHGPVSGNVLPLWVAKDQKLFEKYGLEAELVVVRGTSTVISGLVSGDIDIGYTGGTGVVGGAPGGADLKVVASFFNKTILRVVARPEIEKIEELKGKRLGVQSIGGAGWMQAMLALEQLGLEPRRDNIAVLSGGVDSVRIQALEAGSIDFTVFSDVSFALMLKPKGFRILAETPPIPFASLGIVVQRRYIQRQGEVLENVLKALAEAVAFALSPERKTSIIGLMTKRLNIRSEAVEERYKEIPRILDRKPYTSIEGMQNIQRLMKLYSPQVAKIDAQGLVDNSIIEKLDQSGFLDRLQNAYGVK